MMEPRIQRKEETSAGPDPPSPRSQSLPAAVGCTRLCESVRWRTCPRSYTTPLVPKACPPRWVALASASPSVGGLGNALAREVALRRVPLSSFLFSPRSQIAFGNALACQAGARHRLVFGSCTAPLEYMNALAREVALRCLPLSSFLFSSLPLDVQVALRRVPPPFATLVTLQPCNLVTLYLF